MAKHTMEREPSYQINEVKKLNSSFSKLTLAFSLCEPQFYVKLYPYSSGSNIYIYAHVERTLVYRTQDVFLSP